METELPTRIALILSKEHGSKQALMRVNSGILTSFDVDKERFLLVPLEIHYRK